MVANPPCCLASDPISTTELWHIATQFHIDNIEADLILAKYPDLALIRNLRHGFPSLYGEPETPSGPSQTIPEPTSPR